MLIKTADPVRQVEKMLQKRAWRRRMARRHQSEQVVLPEAAVLVSTVETAQPWITRASSAQHHVKRHAAAPRKPAGFRPPWRRDDLPHAIRRHGSAAVKSDI